MAVIIWCRTSGQMAFAQQCMSANKPPYFYSYCCICMYFSTPINVGTVIVSFINFKSFLKSFLVCLKQLIQKYNLPQQLHHLVLIFLAQRRCQYHIIEFTFSLSFHIPYIRTLSFHIPYILGVNSNFVAYNIVPPIGVNSQFVALLPLIRCQQPFSGRNRLSSGNSHGCVNMLQEYDWVLGFPPSCSIELHARWNIHYTRGMYPPPPRRTLRGEHEQAMHCGIELLCS